MDINILTIISIATLIVAVFVLIKSAKPTKDSQTQYMIEHLEDTLREEIFHLRNEQANNISALKRDFESKITQMASMQFQQLSGITKNNNDIMIQLGDGVYKRLEDLRNTVDAKLMEISKNTDNHLEKMRSTVDEKLQKTLETRLGESFKLVSDRLEQVQKGLGEMQNLAVGVGDLKKVLSNVKTRGILGELQLESILEQILAKEQYEKNVKVNKNSNNIVEFAIKLPGKEGTTYLPIDSKFHMESYTRLVEAYEKGDVTGMQNASKELVASIKKSALDISSKYIDPPNTTDFAIMFLSTEGLYAEVVKQPELLEFLQTKYKVVVAGPTTFAALLNSLLMGFRTLSVQKRSGEVFNLLEQVKTEFGKFYEVLQKAQRKITDAGTEIDRLVGERTKKIVNSLNKVTALEEEVKLAEDAPPIEIAGKQEIHNN